MECSVCHKEFGNGERCQHCGIDKFTGLAHFRGYETPSRNETIPSIPEIVNEPSMSPETLYVSNVVEEKTMICYACGKVIPADSKYCPLCSTELFVKCPKCGHEYSSQYPSCNQCGTNREQYLKEEKERQERQRREEIKKQEEWEKQRQKAEELARKKAEEERIKEEKRLESERRWRESEAGKKAIRDKELRDWAVKYCEDELEKNKREFQDSLVFIIVFIIFSPLGVILGGVFVAGLLTPFTNYELNDKVGYCAMFVIGVVCFFGIITCLFRLKLPHNQTKKKILYELLQDNLDADKKKYLEALYDQVYGKEG